MNNHEIYAQALFVVILLYSVHIICSDDGKHCEGRKDGCCEGYMFNDTLGECTECKTGYFGENCSMPCPPGYYGQGCKLSCNCLTDECDLVLGCERDKATNAATVYRTSVQAPVREKGREMSPYSLMAKVLIGHVILLCFVIMAHAALCIIKRHSK
uniref:Multiple epidermal growth factor-like domains protein 10 n=1 Tax=Crassostrea virginica TaxID=6565 RepID=A0A8B8AIP3_CRAVI|nr:multiple epidermal growth factor-like domains protein 10 [Crassostrea virginica]